MKSPLAVLIDASIQQTTQTRTRLTVAEKAAMATELLQGAQIAHIVQDYNCSEWTAYNVKANAERYIELAASGSTASAKCEKAWQYPDIETSLFAFVGAARTAQMSLKILVLKHEALHIREKLL